MSTRCTCMGMTASPSCPTHGRVTPDLVNQPPHYIRGGMECIDVIEAFGLDKSFCLANAVKYILRSGSKGDAVTDLRKAIWYLQRYVDRAEGIATTDGRAKAEKVAERAVERMMESRGIGAGLGAAMCTCPQLAGASTRLWARGECPLHGSKDVK